MIVAFDAATVPNMLAIAGTIINAPMNRKYVLTADHCFVDKKQINNFRYWHAHILLQPQCACCFCQPASCGAQRRLSYSDNDMPIQPLLWQCTYCGVAMSSLCSAALLPTWMLCRRCRADCWPCLCRLLVFNYKAPCGATDSPPITDVIQVSAGHTRPSAGTVNDPYAA